MKPLKLNLNFAESAVSTSCLQWTHGCTDNWHWITARLKKTLKHDISKASSARVGRKCMRMSNQMYEVLLSSLHDDALRYSEYTVTEYYSFYSSTLTLLYCSCTVTWTQSIRTCTRVSAQSSISESLSDVPPFVRGLSDVTRSSSLWLVDADTLQLFSSRCFHTKTNTTGFLT